MAPRGADREHAGTPEDVPLDADWPDLDASAHRLRADHGTLREVAARLLDQVEAYQRGRGSPADVAVIPPASTWGGWEPAAPVGDAAAQAMRHVLAAYRRLLAEYEAAGRLLLQTARNYAEAAAGARAAASAGRDATGGW